MTAVLVLGVIGLIAAVILFVASKKFAVKEDPRLKQVNEVLPGANCGGCGFPGCSGKMNAMRVRKAYADRIREIVHQERAGLTGCRAAGLLVE